MHKKRCFAHSFGSTPSLAAKHEPKRSCRKILHVEAGFDAADLADYNAVVDSGNKDAIRWALKSLMSMQSAPRRQEPKLIGGRPPSAEPTFNSKQQVLNAMNKKDERGRRLYDVDPAYREKVSEALARSNVF